MWIESHQGLARHPKTLRLARSLGISVPAAIGHLHLLWWWCLDYAQNGSLNGFDPSDLAIAVMWDGDAQKFVEALVASHFLDQDDDSYSVHDWEVYTGRLIEHRKANYERLKQFRAKRNANDMHIIQKQNANDEGLPTIPNQPNHTNKTREKKGALSTGRKPSGVEEVQREIARLGYHVDAESFFAFYESKGWKVGSQPVVKWQACLTTWEKRGLGAPVQTHPPQKLSSPAVGQHPAGGWTPSNPEEAERYARALRGEIVE